MKIDQQNLSGVNQSAGTTAAGSNQAGASRSVSTGDSGDQAEISGASRAIQSFHSDGANRVTQLSAAFQNGSYNVDPALVSSSIVTEALSASAGR